jgi:hypothetical protein
MSTVVFRYSDDKQFKKNGIGHTIKKHITEGERGLSFLFLKKEGNNFYKIDAREVSKDKFNVKERKGDKDTMMDLSLADVKKMLNENKDLDFIKHYIDKERGTYKGITNKDNSVSETKKKKKSITGGAKKKSKQVSKKKSKQVSKKKISKKKVSKKKKSKQ